MRVLLSSTVGAGHFGPLVPFLDTLARRGDDVLIVVPPGLADSAAATGHEVKIGADPPADELAAVWDRFPTAAPAEAAVLANREIFGRLDTAAMLRAQDEACREWKPDLVLHEPAEFASAIAADRYGIAHAQVAISLAEIEAGSLALAAPALEPYADGIVERIRTSAYVTRFPESVDPSPYPQTRRYREALDLRRDPLPEWWAGEDAPLVYVTFGSIAGGLPVGASACRAALDAVAGLPVRVLLTSGRVTDLGAPPANVHVEAWVAQGDVLAHASAVVCHGGSGTTFGALSAGVPLVVVPLFADQPVNARCVAAAGAGIVVEPDPGAAADDRIGPQTAPRIRAAIEAVLAERSYRDAARRMAREMRAMPVVDEVLSALR